LAGVIEHQGEKKNNQNKKIVESIIDYINNNLSSSSITINEIANQIFFSPNYISIIFKKETGNVLSDYIIHMKMEKAKKLLQDPQYKVYQAANAVGYTSVSYFCTLFKKTYGVSPNEYKGMV
jgi:two-component system response regulator YesN